MVRLDKFLCDCGVGTRSQVKDMIKSGLSALLISLFRSKKSAQERKNHLIKQGIAYIDANYANQISLSDVANELSVRSEHLSRTFKKHTGFGFNEYLTIYRINTAEKMILENQKLMIGLIISGSLKTVLKKA